MPQFKETHTLCIETYVTNLNKLFYQLLDSIITPLARGSLTLIYVHIILQNLACGSLMFISGTSCCALTMCNTPLLYNVPLYSKGVIIKGSSLCLRVYTTARFGLILLYGTWLARPFQICIDVMTPHAGISYVCLSTLSR